jgi:hypothetical protein
MSNKSSSVLDDAWDSVVGGMAWLKNVLLGEFADNRSLSAVVADMLISFVPGVVIVTSARDAVAVILRLASHPEKRDELMEWVLLAACMITIALPLAMAAGGVAAAGVGAIVGGIAGSELGAALRAVMLLLIKEAAKLGDLIRFLQKFVHGDILAFLKAIRFAKYERALVMAVEKTINKLLEICRKLREYMEHVSYFDDAKRAIRTLAEWEAKFYAVQKSALKQLPLAIAELDARLSKVLAQMAPKDTHTVVTSTKAHKPVAHEMKAQQINDTPGKILRPKPEGTVGKRAAPQASATPPGDGKPPRKDKPDKIDKVDEGPNAKRLSSLDGDFAEVYAKAPAAKAEIDALADDIAARHGGRVAKAPIKSEQRAMEKIVNDYGGDASKIKDLARNTIIVPADKIDDVVRDLEQSGAKVKRILAEADPYGYSGVNSNLPTKSGLLAEIQVNSPEMIYAKEPEALARVILGNDTFDKIAAKTGVEGGLGHAFYEQGRSLLESPQLDEIRTQSRTYYESIRNAINGPH